MTLLAARHIRTALATSIGITCSFQATADNVMPVKESPNNLEAVVITAAGHEQSTLNAPASISVISREQLELLSYKDISDALKTIPGVTFDASKQEISVRGMPVEYTVLLVDGKKQSGRETQPNGAGGFEKDWLPPLEAIDRIEVVRGPMSTLYGSDAIGGVINVITRKDNDQWMGNLRLETTLQDDSDSGTHKQGQLYVAGPIIKDLLNVSLSGLYQEREEDRINRGYGGKELDNYRGAIHLTPNNTDTVSLDASKQDQKRFTTEDRSSSSTTETNNNRESISLSHNGNYNWGSGSSYLQTETVENEGRDITIENKTFNTQWSLPSNLHFVTVGAAAGKEQLDDSDTNAGEATSISNYQWSIFAEDEWLLTEGFTLTMGLRLDDNEQFSSHLSPKVYGVWNMADNWTVKSGISTGYQAPALRDMSANWVQASRGGDIFGNPDLNPETSLNSEIGVYYSGEKNLETSITVFHNDFTDKISTVDCPVAICGDDEDDYRYNINIDDAVTYGAEATASMDVTQSISLVSSYSYTYSEQTSGDNKGLPLTEIPQNLASININWTISDSLSSWVQANHIGKESRAISETSRNVVRAPEVTYTDIGVSWKVSNNLALRAAVYNLFDENVTYDEFGFVEDGRRYWLAIDTQF